jgi:hypothetical protein
VLKRRAGNTPGRLMMALSQYQRAKLKGIAINLFSPMASRSFIPHLFSEGCTGIAVNREAKNHEIST